MSLRLTHNKGSLLLEALLSVMILSISLAVIIQSMSAALRASVYSAQYTTALILLENKMAELLKEKTIDTGLQEENNFATPHNRYQYSLKTHPLNDIKEDNINQVNLDVLWTSGTKKNRLGVSTYFLNEKL